MHETTASPDLVDDALVANLARAAMFAALMGAFAYVSFPYPLSPAPVTLQVLGVFLAGILLGPVWGSVAIVIYLVAGGLGAPVFSMGAAGTGVLFGETMGYLFAFPIAAAAVGLVVHGGLDVSDHRRRSVPRLVGAMALGVVIIYVLGVAGLMIRLELGPIQAIAVGAVAFVPADAIKIAAAIGIVRSDRLAAL